MDNKKYWFFGSKLNTVLLLILIVLMIIALRFMFQNKETYLPFWDVKERTEIVDNTIPKIENKQQILGNKDDLISFSIAPNTKVHGILSYRGVIKGGYFFEANILINILDKNKKTLKESNGVTKEDWMTTAPISFEGNIDFTGLPLGPAYLEIHNDNPAGSKEGISKSILIPIIIE
ncbi:MAG: hypothetical protein WCW04_03635 [Candidatus Paceibacterota bacterium]